MFGRRKQLTPYQKFEVCPHKSVTPTTHGKAITSVQLSCPYTEDKGMDVSALAATSADKMGHRTTFVEYGSRSLKAYNDLSIAAHELGRVASDIACKTCTFATMTPLEVAEARTDNAMQQLLVNEAEERRSQILAKMKDQLGVATENVMAQLDAALDAAQPQLQPPTEPGPNNLLDLSKRLRERET